MKRLNLKAAPPPRKRHEKVDLPHTSNRPLSLSERLEGVQPDRITLANRSFTWHSEFFGDCERRAFVHNGMCYVAKSDANDINSVTAYFADRFELSNHSVSEKEFVEINLLFETTFVEKYEETDFRTEAYTFGGLA